MKTKHFCATKFQSQSPRNDARGTLRLSKVQTIGTLSSIKNHQNSVFFTENLFSLFLHSVYT